MANVRWKMVDNGPKGPMLSEKDRCLCQNNRLSDDRFWVLKRLEVNYRPVTGRQSTSQKSCKLTNISHFCRINLSLGPPSTDFDFQHKSISTHYMQQFLKNYLLTNLVDAINNKIQLFIACVCHFFVGFKIK